MHSTSQQPSTTVLHRRAHVAAFWALTTSALAVGAGATALVAGAPRPLVWGLGAVLVAAPGFVWPPWFSLGVKAWNGGSRILVRALRTYVIVVTYYLLIVPVSRSGSAPGAAAAETSRSAWIGCARPDAVLRAAMAMGDGRWLRRASVRHLWAVALFPTLWLLRLLGDAQLESAPPSATYTLY